MGNFIDLTGQKFGRLKVGGLSHKDKWGTLHWNCLCECGSSVTAQGRLLKSGNTISCGCFHREMCAKRWTRHGESNKNGRKTPEYKAWAAMKRRCKGANSLDRACYVARGITVCDRWLNGDGEKSGFECFLHDMGRKPGPEFTLDRIDNNKGYSPDNCRWATREDQSNNRRDNWLITWQGRTQTVAQWEHKLGMRRSIVRNRLNRGWSIERALTEPAKRYPARHKKPKRDNDPRVTASL